MLKVNPKPQSTLFQVTDEELRNKINEIIDWINEQKQKKEFKEASERLKAHKK